MWPSLQGVADYVDKRAVLLINAEQKALRAKERQLRRALLPDEAYVAAAHEAKLRAPVDEAEDLLRGLAEELLSAASEQVALSRAPLPCGLRVLRVSP